MLGMTHRRDAAARSAAPLFELRQPTGADGPAVSALIRACPPLDHNSRYCNLLQCTDFADTCVLAEAEERPLGWVSAYKPPKEPSTLFVWQVAVHPDARGLSLGKLMILDILRRPVCSDVEELKTTVTPDNDASRGMFHSLAKSLDASADEELHFDKDRHFGNHHQSEHLITIGKFTTDDL